MVHIRRAEETDVPRLQELYKQLALDPSENDLFDSEPESDITTFQEIENVPGYHLLVAEDDHVIVGTVTLVVLPGLSRGGRRWAVIEYVVVDEARRSEGIGQALMEYATETARNAGCYDIMLSSNKKRRNAHRFYRRIGYEATHEAFHRSFK